MRHMAKNQWPEFHLVIASWNHLDRKLGKVSRVQTRFLSERLGPTHCAQTIFYGNQVGATGRMGCVCEGEYLIKAFSQLFISIFITSRQLCPM